jgi:long-chain acyl-CoA synthetase
MEKPWFKHYEAQVPKMVEIPERTMPDVFEAAVHSNPQTPAMIFFGRRFSYAEFGKLVNRFAAALAHLGVKKGDRVAIILPNLPQYPVAHYAAMKLGAIAVPTNPLYVERELEYQFNNSGAEVVIALDRLYKRIETVRPRTQLRAVIYTSVRDYLPAPLRMLYPIRAKREGSWVTIPKQALHPTGIAYQFLDLMKRAAKGEFPPAPGTRPKPEDIAIFLYTGGTTGISKGAVLTHRNLVANMVQLRAWNWGLQEGREIILGALPFFHSYGMTTCMHIGVYIRGTVVLVPRFDLKMVLTAIEKFKVSSFPGVPTMYVAINNYPDTPKFNLRNIRACNSGGAPLPLEVAKKFEEITGGRLVEGYGLSETSPVTHSNPIFGARREGSIGLPLPCTDAAIVDPETRRPLPVGEIGELAVHGPQVMKGYWQMAEETQKVLQDGWLFTGDMARMDEDGYFYIVDRKKDMIIAGGFNIYPREIEEVLYKHPKVMEAAVIGVQDPYRGETVKAFIVLREGKTATEEEIIEFCKQEMARYKVPKLIEFRKELPKSLIGKVLRRVLMEEEKAKVRENAGENRLSPESVTAPVTS